MSEQTTALATRQPVSRTLQAYEGADAKDTRGKEGITTEDIRLPFLSIAQKTSDALDEEKKDKYIEGLKFLQMYNPETREIYGLEVEIIPLVSRKRACLVLDNGKMGDEIPWDDPRASWDHLKEGQEKPEALQIYDWAVLLVPSYELVLVSFKSKSFGAGKSLNGFVKLTPGPSFGAKYKLVSARDENESGAFGKFAVKPAGKCSKEEYEFAEGVFTSISGRNIVSTEDREPGSDDAPDAPQQPARAGNTPF